MVGLSVELFLVQKEPDLDCVLMATRIMQRIRLPARDRLWRRICAGYRKSRCCIYDKSRAIRLTTWKSSGRVVPLENPSPAYIAIPTTAGTGSEVTRNAVISLPEKRIKVSLRSPLMLPRIAVIDPELTYTLPPSVTASTGLDALTQLIEPFVCNSPTPLTDAICRDGLIRAARSLQKACENGQDANAREDMSLASLFGGLALANARLGAVHGMANPIGGSSHAPHGAVCARLLPLVMETNLHALRARLPASPAIARYTEVARLLTGDGNASAEAGVDWVRRLCNSLDIRPLQEYGLTPDDFPDIVEKSQKASSMKGNPVGLTDTELLSILNTALVD